MMYSSLNQLYNDTKIKSIVPILAKLFHFNSVLPIDFVCTTPPPLNHPRSLSFFHAYFRCLNCYGFHIYRSYRAFNYLSNETTFMKIPFCLAKILSTMHFLHQFSLMYRIMRENSAPLVNSAPTTLGSIKSGFSCYCSIHSQLTKMDFGKLFVLQIYNSKKT